MKFDAAGYSSLHALFCSLVPFWVDSDCVGWLQKLTGNTQRHKIQKCQMHLFDLGMNVEVHARACTTSNKVYTSLNI